MITNYKRILVPVDVEHDDGMANASMALDLARRIGTEDTTLVAVGVIPGAHDLPQVFHDKWRALMSRARSQLDLLVAAGIDDGEHMESHLLSHEDIAGELLRAAKRFDVDLIVMPSHRKHGLARLSSSVAEQVSRDAPVTVLLIRQPDDE